MKKKLTINTNPDRIVLIFWTAYSLINVIPHYINEWFGGICNMAIIWLYLFYFAFVYKRKYMVYKKPESIHNKNVILLFVIFALWYVFDYQFLYNSTSTYVSYGVQFSNAAWNMFSFFPQVLSAVFIIIRSDKEDYIVLKKSLIVMSAIVFIASIVLLNNSSSGSYIAKLTATGGSEYYPFFYNYSIIYGFSIISPFLISKAIYEKRKLFYCLYFALIVYGIFRSSFFIALMAMVIGIVIFFAYSIKNKLLRALFIVLLVGAAFVLVGSGLYVNIVSTINDKINNEELNKRISQLLVFTETGATGDTTSRILLYTKSLAQIWKHPITGNILWDNNCFISGHSTILDIWNGCGILLLILLGTIGYDLVKINAKKATNTYEKAALLASTIALIFTAVFNPIIASPFVVVLWLLAPGAFNAVRTKEIINDNC